MNERQAADHIADQCAALFAKRTLLLTVEVSTTEAAEELLRWMYAEDKPMKCNLLEIAWDKVAVPSAIAEAAIALVRASGA